MKAPSLRPLIARTLASAALLATAHGVSAQTLTWGPGGAGGSGTWSTSVANWSNGTSTVPWTNGSAAVFAGTAGTVGINGSVTASQVTFSTAGYLVQNFFLLGTSSGLTVRTDANATINSSIFGAAPSNTTFTKTGSGTLAFTLGAGPTFFGSINVAAGELRYGGDIGPNASTAYVLGNTAGAALTFSPAIATVGSLAGGGANGGVVRPTGTSGNVTFNMNGVGNASYAGTFDANGTTFTLQKSGSGTQALTARSFFSGTVVVNGGTLALGGADGALGNVGSIVVNQGGTFQLDNSAAVNQTRLGGAATTLAGGTFNLVGNTASQDVHQTVGALNVKSGASTVSVTSAGTGVAQLIFDKPTRSAGATVAFTGGGQITLGSGFTGDPSVILGGYATVGADWATLNTNGGVIAYSGYSSDTTTASNADNLRVATAGGGISLAGVQGRNSLNLVNTGGAAAVADLGANGSLTLTSGGLLTSGPLVIQNGKIASNTGELIVTNQAALTVASVIGSDLTKSGAGTLTLTGNNLSKPTTINQGTVQAAADANLGASGGAVVLNGGTLQTTGSFNSTKSLQGTGGTVDTVGNNVTFDSSTGNTASFTKTGAGVLTLTRTSGNIAVNGGTLRLTNLVGGNTTAVTVANGRLEAGVNGLQSVTSFGGSNVALSPGQVGQAESFIVNSLTLLNTTTMDFDVGGSPQTGNDFLNVGFNLTLSGSQLLFRFNNLGNVQPGTTYSLVSLPSSQINGNGS